MRERYDLVIVGMGSGGMVAAELAASLDLRVAVVEASRVGGDCLWTGCVPSKALLAAGKVAHRMRTAADFGITAVEPEIDRSSVWERVRSVRQQLAATDDDPDRFRDLGIDVIMGHARLTGPGRVLVEGDGGRELTTRHTLLCTGSRPAPPSIDGLEDAGFVTSEDLFELTDPPASFVNLGGGPTGVEMAQACARLGIPVTLLQRGPRILPRDEPALVERLTDQLRKEGVDLRCRVDAQRVTVEGHRKVVHGTEDGAPTTWSADELLVAVGRTPNVEGLGLADLGIETTPRGIAVDDRGRTSVRTIYACGDVVGRQLFTHSAAYEAARAVRDMFFPGAGKVVAPVPWCTFTDPELAQTGLTEAEARARFGSSVDVWRADLTRNDRARTDGAGEGAIVVVTHKRRIVGAQILAPAAGEMIHELALAIEQRVGLSELSRLVHVYPTLSTSIARLAADAAFEKARRLRWLVRRG